MNAAKLELAVQSGDCKTVYEFVENSRNNIPKWLTPALRYEMLCRAVAHRDKMMVAMLLRLSPVLDLDEETRTILSPLWNSVIDPHVDIARLLLKAGADLHRRLGPNMAHDRNSTMLHYAIWASSPPERNDLLGLLLEHGADVNALDSWNRTPMHLAVMSNNLDAIVKLLDRGADVDARDKDGDTPMLASCRGIAKVATVELLVINGANPYACNYSGQNALHLLAAGGYDNSLVAEVFLKLGVPLKEKDLDKRCMPLTKAVMMRKEKLTKMFLEYGADANYHDQYIQPPLILALAHKSPVVIEALLLHGADLTYRTKRGKTPLHLACRNMTEKNILVLLEYGADINALDYDGATPFSLIEYRNLSKANQAMIRTIARRVAIKKHVNKADLGIIQEHEKLQQFYNECLEEIEKMKNIKFFNDMPYFTMFSKNLVNLTLLLRDRRFRFPLRIKQINYLFPIYAKDFQRALQKAETLFPDLEHTEDMMNAIFSTRLPHTVLREIMLAVLPSYVHA